MDDECINLIKTFGFYDLVIGIIISLILSWSFGMTSLVFLLGIMCSFINFTINTLTIEMQLMREMRFKTLIVILSYICRIVIVCGTSLAIIIKSEVSFFIFIAGYTAQLIAVLFYGFKLTRQERV